ncbi:MAG: hypothetical protein HYU36_07620 [Planctomycetes bacterium]|nr:hypothetical protein [Planctomycetota bacterium]
MKTLQILLLCNEPRGAKDAGTIVDHIHSFSRYSRHQVFVLSNLGRLPPRLDLDAFDVLVIHYSIYVLGESYLDASAKESIRRFQGLKIQFIQDEYRTINAFLEAMRHLGIAVLFTCVPDEEIEKVYPPEAVPGLRKVNNLTGYVPEDLLGRRVSRMMDRPVDVGYRGRRLPYWYGALAMEKWQIAEGFLAEAPRFGLKCDISCREEDRLYGRRWMEFLSGCKSTLGVESGASVFDFTGEIERTVSAYVAEHPEAAFEEVQERFLRPHEGKVKLNQVSPRCFEAAALRTGLILFEGHYSGVLEPWRHYVPLKKDFSNLPQVVESLRDTRGLQERVDRAYEEVACNPAHSFRSFVARFDRVVEEEMEARGLRRALRPLSASEFRQRVRPTLRERLSRASQYCRSRLPYAVWGCVPLPVRTRLKPFLKPVLGPALPRKA